MCKVLEKLCDDNKLKYQLGPNGPVVIATGLYPHSSHLVRITLLKNQDVSLLLTTLPSKKLVNNADDFCEKLNARFHPGTHICYTESSQDFLLCAVSVQKHFRSVVANFALDCDVALPLCRSVGEVGYWTPDFLELAYAVPQEMHRYTQ